MKNILVIGSGAMGAAFTIPCLDNNNNVTLCEPYNYELVKKILSKKNFHPALKLNLPKKLVVKKCREEHCKTEEELVVLNKRYECLLSTFYKIKKEFVDD